MSNLKKRIQAFGHAFAGWKWYWSGVHAKVHAIAAIVAISMAWYLDISVTHWTIICLCIACVIAAEMFNSALEEICDQLHPEQSPGIGRAKDMAAGAVLFLALGTLVVGLLIFKSYVFTASN